MDKCCCHINGYEIKDAKARTGLEEEITNRGNAVAEVDSKVAQEVQNRTIAVEEEIQNRINAVATETANRITAVAEVTGKLALEKSERLESESKINSDIAIERERINNLSSLPEGSTTGDAELIDGRTDYKGNTHQNLGTHIRTITNELSENITDLSDDMNSNYVLDNQVLLNKIHSHTGFDTEAWLHINNLPTKKNVLVKIIPISGVNEDIITQGQLFETYDNGDSGFTGNFVEANKWYSVALRKDVNLTALSIKLYRSTSLFSEEVTSKWRVIVLDGNFDYVDKVETNSRLTSLEKDAQNIFTLENKVLYSKEIVFNGTDNFTWVTLPTPAHNNVSVQIIPVENITETPTVCGQLFVENDNNESGFILDIREFNKWNRFTTTFRRDTNIKKLSIKLYRADATLTVSKTSKVKLIVLDGTNNFNYVLYGKNQVDYAKYGIPVLTLSGDMTGINKSNKVNLTAKYSSSPLEALPSFSDDCTLKWQGSSSVGYPKKNYTITFGNEHDFGWGSQKKYCLKANYIDFSHARNICSAKLWAQIVETWDNTSGIKNAPNNGAIDGFPIMLVINGAYVGLYTLNIPKDSWTFGMGEGNNQCLLSAETYSSTTRFKSLLTADKLGDDLEFGVEHASEDMSNERIIESVNNLIGACMDSTGRGFWDNVAPYCIKESFIDYYIFSALLTNEDGLGKNYLMYTYDGTKWGISAYDLDSTFGNHWTGSEYYSVKGGLSSFHGYDGVHRLMHLIYAYDRDTLKARYKELRNGVLSEENVLTVFSNYLATIPKAIKDNEVLIWNTLPGTDTNNLNQIMNYYRLRCIAMDKEIEAL